MLEFDRDSNDILEYAKEVKTYYENESALMKAAVQAVDGCLAELDDKSQALGESFLQNAQNIIKSLNSYNELAIEMEKKATDVIELQNSIQF